MRISIGASGNRILPIGASLLLAGAAVTAATVPAQAAPTPVNVITLSPAGPLTEPLSAPFAFLPITATETDPDATLTLAATGLPPGLSYSQIVSGGDPALTVTGTITTPGVYQVTVTATDDLPAADMATESFTWTAKNNVTLTAPAAEITGLGAAVRPVTVTAFDDDPVATVAFAAKGLTLNAATGEITGTPTGPAGVDRVTVKATDSTGATAKAAIAWTVNKVTVSVKAPKKVYIGVRFTVQPTATDSDRGLKLSWSVSPAHPLPPGMTISKATGLITGRPKRLAAPPTTVIATDSAGSTGSAVIDWVVSVDGYVDNPGTETITVGEGKDIVLSTVDYVPGDKVTWVATGLPDGMGFQPSAMMLYGWPVSAGSYRVTITGHGSRDTYDTMTFKLVVRPAAADAGAAGQIRLALDGACLSDPGGATANGTAVRLERCGAAAGQRWTVDSDGTVRVGGRCLDIAGTGGAAGRPLQLEGCTASPREVWLQGTAGELANPASGLCVTDPGSSKANGTVPAMGACRVKSDEQWTLPAQPILTAVGGSCADDRTSGDANGNVIDMFWCNQTAGQTWTFDTDGTIRAGLFGGKCLTARGALGKPGTKIVLWTCVAGDAGQRWTVDHTGGLSSEIAQHGACLAIPSLTATNATQLVTATCTASDPRVHWHIW